MFGYNFSTLLIILVIALLLFGPKRLPELGESIGKAIRSFKTAHDDPNSVCSQERDSRRDRGARRHLSPMPQGYPGGVRLLSPLRQPRNQGLIFR